mmetsp:Transcript_137804/g.239691  ORF Transcript_137804/g.239691 Transcript_137804/m.239691 type:complete len:243 (+) Transcript_137804:1680-2408(+)
MDWGGAAVVGEPLGDLVGDWTTTCGLVRGRSVEAVVPPSAGLSASACIADFIRPPAREAVGRRPRAPAGVLTKPMRRCRTSKGVSGRIHGHRLLVLCGDLSSQMGLPSGRWVCTMYSGGPCLQYSSHSPFRRSMALWLRKAKALDRVTAFIITIELGSAEIAPGRPIVPLEDLLAAAPIAGSPPNPCVGRGGGNIGACGGTRGSQPPRVSGRVLEAAATEAGSGSATPPTSGGHVCLQQQGW